MKFLALALLLAACRTDSRYEGAFDLPVAAAVLQPEVGGPFDQPVGFVANAVGGHIVPLDLKYGRFLTDDPTASFLRTNWLPTGGARALGAIAVYAPTPDRVTVYAADRAFETLLRVPYVVGLDASGFPIEGWVEDGAIRTEPAVGQVVFEGSGSARLVDIEVKQGYTTTETWTAAYEPVRGTWQVTGSRSGLQDAEARDGEPFVGDQRRIAFTIRGQGREGDTFRFTTDTGVREFPVDGIPYALSMAPDQSVLAMSVGKDGASSVRLFDPDTETVTGDLSLPADAAPGRLAWSEDGGTLFVTDSVRPSFWTYSKESETLDEHVLPFPTMDLAPVFVAAGPLVPSAPPDRLVYLVPLDGQEVWIYDLDARALRDVNAAAQGVQGMPFESPVLGIEAIPLEHLYREVDDQGIRRSGQSVAVSLHEGKVVFMEAGTGCLLQDLLGPRTVVEGSLGQTTDIATNFGAHLDNPTLPFLQPNPTNDRHVVVNGCAGIAQDEIWTLRFDRNRAGWVVTGGVTGEQEALAYEDERYLSDRGEISFVLRAGSQPTEDGWEMTFTVEDGVLEADGDTDGDGSRETELDMPGDPVFFHYTVGPGGVAWDDIDDRAFVLVPAQAADVVGRIDPQEGDVEVRWD